MKKPFSHRATHGFWKLYDQLPDSIQKTADENFLLLKSNPKHPSLHFKHIKDEIWSVRVGMQFRALALEEGDGFTWIWIGTHAEYDRLIG